MTINETNKYGQIYPQLAIFNLWPKAKKKISWLIISQANTKRLKYGQQSQT